MRYAIFWKLQSFFWLSYLLTRGYKNDYWDVCRYANFELEIENGTAPTKALPIEKVLNIQNIFRSKQLCKISFWHNMSWVQTFQPLQKKTKSFCHISLSTKIEITLPCLRLDGFECPKFTYLQLFPYSFFSPRGSFEISLFLKEFHSILKFAQNEFGINPCQNLSYIFLNKNILPYLMF